VLGPGTFNGNPLGMRAVLATLKILEKDNGAAYDKMEKLQLRLTDGLSALAKKHGIPLRIQGARGLFYTAFGLDSDKVLYTEEDLAGIDFQKVLQFWAALKQEGISAVIGGRWYMSIAHTEEDVTRTLEAADKVMATL
jgi:glutamate-1-semialdehyde 2,1-aminomutase